MGRILEVRRLGVMGYPMARHLRAKGHELTVYNRTAAKAEKWVSENGGRAAPTPREAAEGQEIVVVEAGFLIQIDDPRLVSYYTLKPDVSIADCRKWANQRASERSSVYFRPLYCCIAAGLARWTR